MPDKTPPPVNRGDGSSIARGIKPGPAIDHNSDTLHGFVPVAPPSAPLAPETNPNTSELTLTPQYGGTMVPRDSAPAPAAPPPAPDTNPAAGEATLRPQYGGTMVPHDPAPVLAVRPPAAPAQTIAAPTALGPNDQTIAASPDATLGGFDAGTKAFHQAALAAAPKAVSDGQSFGHYELIEPIAKGGMGIVYKARQKNLNRIVAIKMILAGQFADQGDIDRFYAEAEAAAALSHPNIVAIHEIGEMNGQHFFSMDFIEGKSLSGLIQENPVPPRLAAEFTRTIAETMEFAHEKGVVHRDLKPANVLLDKRQRPLITDFGLAKQVSNTSQLTMAGSIVGTPSYMPPEQAAGKIEEVGTWSDLYSIGAILYELLTGRPPFRASNPFETIRQVLETEPPSPRLLNPNVPKDLETICLKCLQKERTRRYSSCQVLADELGRYLRGEPIQARPISQVARFWRLCKRNPITASAIAMAVLVLITATAVSSVYYVKAARALVKSDESLSEAIAAVNDFFTAVSEEDLLNQPGMQKFRQDLLSKPKSYFERFAAQRAGDPKVEVELAGAYFRLGEIASVLESPDEAIKPYLKARDIQEKIVARKPSDLPSLKALGDTVNAIGFVRNRQRDFKEANREFVTAVGIREKIAAADPANAEYQRVLANTHMNIGSIAQANKKFEDARKAFNKAQEIRDGVLKNALFDDPKMNKLRRDFGMCLFNLGNLDLIEGVEGAEEHYKESVAIFENLTTAQPKNLQFQRQLALAYRLVANVLLTKNELDEAKQYYLKALERAEPLARLNPEVVEYSADWAGVYMNLFELESRAGNATAAISTLEKARDILAPLVKQFPTEARCQGDLANTLRELAALQSQQSDNKAAKKNLEEALHIARDLVKQHNQEPYHVMEATILRRLAAIETGPDEGKIALEHLEKAQAILHSLAEKTPTEQNRIDLAMTLRELATAEQAAGDGKSARERLDQALAVMRSLVKEFPSDLNQFDLAMTLRDLANTEHAAGNDASATKYVQESITILADLVKNFPDVPEFKAELKNTQEIAWAK
jgi:serine/threonine protein kinase